MRWIAIFTDTSKMLEVRARFETAHFAFLDRYRDEIVLAGGCRLQPEGDYMGGLWVFEVASRERAVELIEQDPYFIHGARNYELRTWGKAFPGRQVLL
ncbi:YciI family protein [Comamonas guangdongensis]|uniref:YciI family protein n=1 Tax=Comamonas guangdongensis TaxID=510515 RepID=A0ABV3ZTA7_9BURK